MYAMIHTYFALILVSELKSGFDLTHVCEFGLQLFGAGTHGR